MSTTTATVATPKQPADQNLVHFNELPKGGHFAAWEQPLLFSEELRAGFRSLRG
jgi:pimeloyl-ACP methyl ester carboxylesterase